MDFYGPFDSMGLMWAFAASRGYDEMPHFWEKREDQKFYFALWEI